MSHQLLAELDEIFAGASGGSADRWMAESFFSHVLFANSSVTPQYWSGGGQARPIPGLPDANAYDGVCVLASHVILWRDDLVKYSDVNDFTNWVPVSDAINELSEDTLEAFVQPGPGEQTPWLHYADSFNAFVKGQYVRIDLNPDDIVNATYNFYVVSDVASPSGVTADTLLLNQSIPADGESYRVYTTGGVLINSAYSEWPKGARLLLNGTSSNLEVTASSRAISPLFTSAAISDAVPLPGGTFRITVSENPSSLRAGDVLSLGDIAAAGQDLYEITEPGFTLTLRRLNIGTKRQAQGYKFPTGTFLTFQPFVTVKNVGTVTKSIPSGTSLTIQGAVKLTPAGFTGEVPQGTVVPEGSTIQALEPTEAGEFVNAGGQINGPIFAIVALGEYGVILKERSIQSMQYVGRLNGTFFTRPEVLGEGPISKYAYCRVNETKLIFWGNREIYDYSGGANLTPILLQHSVKMFSELDRARADEIVLFHNEPDTQIWFVYPVIGATDTTVVIYNYREGSVVIDKYDAALGGITALGGWDIEVAPAWEDLPETLTWQSETRRWVDLVEDGLHRRTIIATGGDAGVATLGEDPDETIPRLLLHGRVYSRSSGDNCIPARYYAAAETQDFAFNDPSLYKYVDTLTITLAVDEPLQRPMKLWVQLGSRANFDSDILWSTPASIEVSGNGNYVTRVNLRSAGRYHRVRFFSNQVDCQWKIAGFCLYARPGGTY